MISSNALTQVFPALFAAPSPQNAGRPVSTGTCCAANINLKQDVCNVIKQTGRCVASGGSNFMFDPSCIIAITTSANTSDRRWEIYIHQCNANTLEQGRPLCRLSKDFQILN